MHTGTKQRYILAPWLLLCPLCFYQPCSCEFLDHVLLTLPIFTGFPNFIMMFDTFLLLPLVGEGAYLIIFSPGINLWRQSYYNPQKVSNNESSREEATIFLGRRIRIHIVGGLGWVVMGKGGLRWRWGERTQGKMTGIRSISGAR